MEIGTIKVALNKMRHGVYNFTKNGECSCCGNCCSNLLPMSVKEIKRIKAYMKRNHIKEQKHMIPMVDAIDLTCPFLDLSKAKEKCAIYSVRPFICRIFKCDHSTYQGDANEYLSEERMPVDVRQTFFGDCHAE